MLEVCVDSIESAKNAILGGASRLEVCSALSEGGLTPSYGFVKFLKSFTNIPLYVMIRIRPGNFVYLEEEVDAMIQDIHQFKDIDADGFVFGALTLGGDVNVEACEKIITAAQPKPVTFHRAFDECRDPLKCLEVIIDLKFERILTSGQEESCEKGIKLIKRLVSISDERIIIMPGAGITPNNVLCIKNATSVSELHSSAKVKREMQQPYGLKTLHTTWITSESYVRNMVNEIQLANELLE